MQAYLGAKYPGLGAPKEQVQTVTPDALSILCHRVVKDLKRAFMNYDEAHVPQERAYMHYE